MEPRIQTPLLAGVGAVARRHHQSIRLDAAVDRRDVAARHETCLRVPRRLLVRQLGGPLLALLQKLFGASDFFRLEEFVVGKRIAYGIAIDGNVGHQLRIGLYSVDRARKPFESAFQLFTVSGGNSNSWRWDRALLRVQGG